MQKSFHQDRLRAVWGSRWRFRRVETIAGVVLAAALVWIVIAGVVTSARTGGDEASLALAYRLAIVWDDWGRASSAQSDVGKHGGPDVHGARLGYALIAAAIARITPGTRQGLACWAEGLSECRPVRVPMLVLAHILAALAAVFLAHRTALRLSGDRLIALLAVVLALMSMRLGQLAGSLRSMIWYAVLLLAYQTLLVCGADQRSWAGLVQLAVAGSVLTLATLIEPATAVLLPVTIALLTLVGPSGKGAGDGRRSLGADRGAQVAAFLLGVAVMGLLPALSLGYSLSVELLAARATGLLAQRTAFNGVDIHTWLAALVTPVPWLGDMVLTLLPTEAAHKLAVGSRPGSLADFGNSVILPDALARGGGTFRVAIDVLLGERVFGQAAAYLAALPIVLMRGLFAGGGILALTGLAHMGSLVRYARADGRLRLHLLALVPAVALLLANALLTSNEFWHNPMLPLVYAYAIAYVAGGW
ncbi:MAG: hypothetical protein SFW09_04430 [Hyphomicrobiaceae bacterium]|nr:hypothetical protein [Hyphomicrobiaceae bacterium]